jgi:hypothetical protein
MVEWLLHVFQRTAPIAPALKQIAGGAAAGLPGAGAPPQNAGAPLPEPRDGLRPTMKVNPHKKLMLQTGAALISAERPAQN